MADGNVDAAAEPSLWNQTTELGWLLRKISDSDPEGHPSEQAATAFRHWLAAGETSSTDARYFRDVAVNYDIEGRSNRDLFDVFDLLHPYLELAPPEDLEPEPTHDPAGRRVFINLPIGE